MFVFQNCVSVSLWNAETVVFPIAQTPRTISALRKYGRFDMANEAAIPAAASTSSTSSASTRNPILVRMLE